MTEELRRSGRSTKGQHPKVHEDVLASPKPKNVPASPKPKKTPQKKGRKRKAAEPPPETTDEEEDEDKDAIIRCVCGAVTEDPDDERMMICCDKCECWQHNECMELPSDPNLLPESYLCELCAPENHAELLAKMARGEQPWLERARQRKTPRGRRGGRRKTQTKIARTEPKETPPAEKRKTPPAHVVPAADVAQARPSSPVAEAPPATPTPASLKKRKSRSDDAANSPSIDGNVPEAKIRKVQKTPPATAVAHSPAVLQDDENATQTGAQVDMPIIEASSTPPEGEVEKPPEEQPEREAEKQAPKPPEEQPEKETKQQVEKEPEKHLGTPHENGPEMVVDKEPEKEPEKELEKELKIGPEKQLEKELEQQLEKRPDALTEKPSELQLEIRPDPIPEKIPAMHPEEQPQHVPQAQPQDRIEEQPEEQTDHSLQAQPQKQAKEQPEKQDDKSPAEQHEEQVDKQAEVPAEKQPERQVEAQPDIPIERQPETSVENASAVHDEEPPVKQDEKEPAEHVAKAPIKQAENAPAEQVEKQLQMPVENQPVIPAAEEPAKPAEKQRETPIEKQPVIPAETDPAKATEKPASKHVEKEPEKQSQKRPDQHVEKQSEKQREKKAEKRPEKPTAKVPEKRPEKQSPGQPQRKQSLKTPEKRSEKQAAKSTSKHPAKGQQRQASSSSVKDKAAEPNQTELVSSPDELQNSFRRKTAIFVIRKLTEVITADTSKGKYALPEGTSAAALASRLGLEIEHATHMNHSNVPGDPTQAYRQQMRSMTSNITYNHALAERLVKKTLTPDEFSKMTTEQMASEERQREDAELKQKSEKQHILITEEDKPRIRRTHKGEELVGGDRDHDGTDTIFAVPPPRRRESLPPLETPLTTRGSPGSAFSPLTPTANGRVLSPSEMSFGQQEELRRSLSPSNMDGWQPNEGETQEYEPPPTTDALAHEASPPEESLSGILGSGHNTTTDFGVDKPLEGGEAESPPYSPTDGPMGPPVIWHGTLSMPGFADVDCSATHVAGADLNANGDWSHLIPPSMTVEGRISADRATKYLCELRYSRTTDVFVVALAPDSSAFAREQYEKLWSYYYDREKYGVVRKEATSSVRDIYIIPVPAGTGNVPVFMEMLEHNTLPERRPDRLLLITFVLRAAVPLSNPPSATLQEVPAVLPAALAGALPETPLGAVPAVVPATIPATIPATVPAPAAVLAAVPAAGGEVVGATAVVAATAATEADTTTTAESPPYNPPEDVSNQTMTVVLPAAGSISSSSSSEPKTAADVLGPLVDAPAVKGFLAMRPNVDLAEAYAARSALEMVPAARDNLEQLLQLLTAANNQNGGAGVA